MSRYLFGKAFSIVSSLTGPEAKRAVSDCTDYMLSPTKQTGYFGWRVGKLFCIWPYVNRLSNRNGPLAFGWIGEQSGRAKLRGIAGPDVNGTIWFFILIVFFAASDIGSDTLDWETRGWIFAAVVLVVIYAFARRHEADELVEFLSRTVASDAAPRLRPLLDTEWEECQDGPEVTGNESQTGPRS